MRYGIITDLHNNVTALRAILERLDQMNCARIICCGDMIGIGPDPEETVQEMMHIPGLIAVRGNHENYLLEGMPADYPNEENMSFGEMEHHRWEHSLLSGESVAFLRGLPKRIDFVSEGLRVSVMHSCLDENGHYSKSKMRPDECDLMAMFANVNSDVILYGHDHTRNICRGDKLYINVGSLGCPAWEHNIARAGILSIENDAAAIETIDVEYDAAEVVRRINELNYPDAENIKKYFTVFEKNALPAAILPRCCVYTDVRVINRLTGFTPSCHPYRMAAAIRFSFAREKPVCWIAGRHGRLKYGIICLQIPA